jgi:hypothetical protein
VKCQEYLRSKKRRNEQKRASIGGDEDKEVEKKMRKMKLAEVEDESPPRRVEKEREYARNEEPALNLLGLGLDEGDEEGNKPS